MSYLLAIDPGNVYSAYAIVDTEDYAPVRFEKATNRRVEDVVLGNRFLKYPIVIEQVGNYGMPVGREVFQTCEAIGRFSLLAEHTKVCFERMTRKEVVVWICGTARAKDTNVRRALIDRFAKHDLKNGKGTKNKKDWFYGFKADMWSAYALAVAYIDREKERGKNNV